MAYTMKSFSQFIAAAVLFSAVNFAMAADAPKTLLVDKDLPLLASPSFKEALGPDFSVAKGKWTPADGVLAVLDLPDEKHIPVLHHKAGLKTAAIEAEFFLDGPGSFLIGCDGSKHVGRVVVSTTMLSIAEDSVAPSHTVAKVPMTVKPGEWHKIRVEWKGDQMAAILDGQEIKAQHEYLGNAKARSWLAAGKSVKVRNLKISGEQTEPAKSEKN